jgi:(1->4)-alpha-D-glucan 1-alpha-D-glucosylmutase
MPGTRSRIATYRLQLGEGLGFAEASALVDYLAALGVSHLYLSPVLEALPGSKHGYDFADFDRVSEALGGEAGLRALAERAHARGLGLMVDIVPNHMGITHPKNRWFWDVLERGRASPHARYFDIDWENGGEPESRGKIVLPWLARPLPALIDSGDVRLVMRGDALRLGVYQSELPLAPGTAPEAPVMDDREALVATLEAQHYRLEDFREAASHLNYRRFFHINDLMALRIDDQEVFDAAHRLTLALVHDGTIDALRVDHPDGLADPEGYLERLRDRVPGTWIVVEKILEPGEALPARWPVEGTTGYDFLNLVGGLFVDPGGREPLERLYEEVTGERADFDVCLAECKRLVLRRLFPSDVRRVARLLDCVARERAVDLEPGARTKLLGEAIVGLPVYRTYVRRGAPPGPWDRGPLRRMLAHLRSVPELPHDAVGLLERVFWDERRSPRTEAFLERFQQLSGPAMAKGLEDTAFFRHQVLIALCEVGGDPRRFGTSLERFHDHNERIAELYPDTLLATATHDTKRGEDTRMRIAALSEHPERWAEAVRRFRASTRALHDERLDAATEYLFYQTLVGAYPIAPPRITGFMQKAAREAMRHTSWLAPDEAYESSLSRFITRALEHRPFLEELERLLSDLVPVARVHALAEVLLKIASPGVPDFYQGAELWEESLTDPDNRRPVDFEARRALLARAEAMRAEEALGELESGLAKLWVMTRALAVRRAHRACFDRGAPYRALYATGAEADRVIAFERGERVVAVAPRFLFREGGRMPNALLAPRPGRYSDAFTGSVIAVTDRPVDVSRLLAAFPLALLVRDAERP